MCSPLLGSRNLAPLLCVWKSHFYVIKQTHKTQRNTELNESKEMSRGYGWGKVEGQSMQGKVCLLSASSQQHSKGFKGRGCIEKVCLISFGTPGVQQKSCLEDTLCLFIQLPAGETLQDSWGHVTQQLISIQTILLKSNYLTKHNSEIDPSASRFVSSWWV